MSLLGFRFMQMISAMALKSQPQTPNPDALTLNWDKVPDSSLPRLKDQLLRQASNGDASILLRLLKVAITIDDYCYVRTPQYKPGNLFMAPPPNTAGAITSQALSCLCFMKIALGRIPNRGHRCKQHHMYGSDVAVFAFVFVSWPSHSMMIGSMVPCLQSL